MLKAVIFDVDGTLAETEEFHRRAFNAAFVAHRIDAEWSVEQYRALLSITGGKERLAAFFGCGTAGGGASGHGALDPETIAALHGTKNRLYARSLLDGSVRLRPGVLRLLRGARGAGLQLGIATTTSPENLDALLAPLIASNWADWFGAVVAGDQVEHKKPAPDAYVVCLQRLAVRAGEAVAIEDSYNGVRAARAAGLAVLATPSLYCAADDLSGAQAVVPDLGDPQAPWPQRPEGFGQPWVEFADLERLLERTTIAMAA